MEDTGKEWLIPAGTTVKIGGIPYAVVDETALIGFHAPTAMGPYSGANEESGAAGVDGDSQP